MLSHQGKAILLGAMLAFASVMPVSANEPQMRRAPVASLCADLRKEMLYYFSMYEKGGTAKQVEVWKKQYKRRIHTYGQSRCRELEKRTAKALAAREAGKAASRPAGYLANRDIAR